MKNMQVGLLSLVFLFILTHSIFAQVSGNQDALVLVDQMFETIGGKNVWKNAKSINVKLTGYYAREVLPWHENYWMDLEQPRGKFNIKNKEKDQIIAWTPEVGWDMNNGKAFPLDSAHHAFEMSYWKIQPVVVFHRLATGIPETRVEMGDNEFRFDVFDSSTDRLIAQFALNENGKPIKWGSKIGEREFEQVFGPLKKYDNVIMPCWGTVLSGVWRYEHNAISLSNEISTIDFTMPKQK